MALRTERNHNIFSSALIKVKKYLWPVAKLMSSNQQQDKVSSPETTANFSLNSTFQVSHDSRKTNISL